jgi:transcriptional regulator with XRE-family HTH domain
MMGRLIRARRKQLQLSQSTLAERVSLTRTSITNIEQGRQKIQIHTLWDIAKALDVHASTLLPPPEKKETEKVRERVKALPPDERKFAESVLSKGG